MKLYASSAKQVLALWGKATQREHVGQMCRVGGGDGNGMGQTLLSRAFAEGADELPYLAVKSYGKSLQKVMVSRHSELW